MQCSGLRSRPDLSYVIRLYDNIDAGEIRTEIRNRTGKPITVQSFRSVESIGDSPLDLNAAASSDRILSDSFSEDWPPLKIEDSIQAPVGIIVPSAANSSRTGERTLRFSSVRSLPAASSPSCTGSKLGEASAGSYTVDSTGTTEIQSTDSGVRAYATAPKRIWSTQPSAGAGGQPASESPDVCTSKGLLLHARSLRCSHPHASPQPQFRAHARMVELDRVLFRHHPGQHLTNASGWRRSRAPGLRLFSSRSWLRLCPRRIHYAQRCSISNGLAPAQLAKSAISDCVWATGPRPLR